jgi:hypothetical protein
VKGPRLLACRTLRCLLKTCWQLAAGGYMLGQPLSAAASTLHASTKREDAKTALIHGSKHCASAVNLGWYMAATSATVCFLLSCLQV